jgi:type 1 glutamine amidotransferase
MKYILATLGVFLITTYSIDKKVLVFTKTNGYRHESIEKGVEVINKLGLENGFKVIHSENSDIFTTESLKEFDLVIFLNTTEDILDDEGQRNFEMFIRNGGSFMGIHSAADTEYDWPWYGKLVGAYFKNHPNNPSIRDAEIIKEDSMHVSCKHLPDRWERTDEWYNYKEINPDINILLRLNESSYEGGEHGDNHPIAWYHEFDGGKAFYTGGGHTRASFDEIDFKQHILGGILYCLGN